jgi:peptide/nickel transport system permease protein
VIWFLMRRFLLIGPILFGLLLLTFSMIHLVPTDPAAALAGEQATAAQIEEIRRAHGFDRPLIEQFATYLGNVLTGNLGIGIYSNRPVSEEILERLPATIELTFFALLLSAVIGIPLGVVAAAFHNGWIDQLLRVVTISQLAIASFWMAIMLQLIFSMYLGWLPLQGRVSVALGAPPHLTGFYLIDSLAAGRLDIFFDVLVHLIMPAVTLALGAMATITRFTRSSVVENLQADYVAYERAIGYPRPVLLGKYVLRNSVVVPVTQIGLLFGSMLSSAVVIEAIFQWPGLGSYAVTAITTGDYQAILAVTLVIGVLYAVINILVDIAHALIDPRVREQL